MSFERLVMSPSAAERQIEHVLAQVPVAGDYHAFLKLNDDARTYLAYDAWRMLIRQRNEAA